MHHDAVDGKQITEINDHVLGGLSLIVDLDVGGPAVGGHTVVDKLARPTPGNILLACVAGHLKRSVQGNIHALGIYDLLCGLVIRACSPDRAVVHKDLDLGYGQSARISRDLQLDIACIDCIKGKAGDLFSCIDIALLMHLLPALAVSRHADDHGFAKALAQRFAAACGIDIHAVELGCIPQIYHDLGLLGLIGCPSERAVCLACAVAVVEIVHILLRRTR